MPETGDLARNEHLAAPTEVELVERLIDGDHDAMAAIFDRYYGTVMRVALHIVRDPGEAQDVAQIVFSDFYRAAKLFDPAKGNLKTWLLQYAYGRSINRKQSLKLRNFYDHDGLDEIDATRYSADSRILDLETREASRLIEQILTTLDNRHRQVIEMVCFRGMTMAEVAASTGESLGNVQHRYYRGIEKLRAYVRNGQKSLSSAAKAKSSNSLFCRLRDIKRTTKENEVEVVKARAL